MTQNQTKKDEELMKTRHTHQQATQCVLSLSSHRVLVLDDKAVVSDGGSVHTCAAQGMQEWMLNLIHREQQMDEQE